MSEEITHVVCDACESGRVFQLETLPGGSRIGHWRPCSLCKGTGTRPVGGEVS